MILIVITELWLFYYHWPLMVTLEIIWALRLRTSPKSCKDLGVVSNNKPSLNKHVNTAQSSFIQILISSCRSRDTVTSALLAPFILTAVTLLNAPVQHMTPILASFYWFPVIPVNLRIDFKACKSQIL